MSITIQELNEKRDALADDIAEQLAAFEHAHGVTIQSVSANPKPRRTEEGDANEWGGQVRIRLSL